MRDYYTFVEQLVSEGRTTGEDQSERMIHYTQLNFQRMKRWKTTGKLLHETAAYIKALDAPQTWTVLTESWCGDAAHSFLFIQKMADLNPVISLEWKLRDEHPALMDRYLTNGGRAIPKLIVTQGSRELFHWGPRPKIVQQVYQTMRDQGRPYDEISTELQRIYNRDKGVAIQEEIVQLHREHQIKMH